MGNRRQIAVSANKKHDTVTALAEEDATGEIADIFADIRETMKIPMLTSIWRILAESKDDLASTWAAIKPMYATGKPEDALVHLEVSGAFPRFDPPTSAELRDAQINPTDLQRIKSIIRAYTRSNSLNLLTQTALVATPDRTPEDYGCNEYGTIDTPWEIPRLLAREEIPDSVWHEVLRVNLFGTNEDDPGLATIYRHLAYWPGMLKLVQTRLESAEQAGDIARGAASVVEIAKEQGSRLAHLRDESRLNEMSDEAKSTVEHYVDGPFNVARVVNIGTALSRWLKTS